MVAGFGPVRQTHIMYKANLTWEGLKEDLTILKSLNTIQEVVWEEGIFYTITQIGREVLSHFSGIEQILKVADQKAPSIAIGNLVDSGYRF